jgi:glucokinase
LYSGNNCGAGEFGMIPFRKYIYEYYCCGQYFKNEFGLSGSELFDKAEEGNFTALTIFSMFGENLGEAIKMIMFAVDPEVIVLGGSVSKSYKFFKEEMWKTIKTFAYTKSVERIKIEVSERENIAILGAAALNLDAKKNKSVNIL